MCLLSCFKKKIKGKTCEKPYDYCIYNKGNESFSDVYAFDHNQGWNEREEKKAKNDDIFVNL